MRIAHWAPFAPHRCGLYEAARDCARADYLRDHEVLFVDTGVVSALGGDREPGRVGAIDPRGGWALTTVTPDAAMDADLWVCHDGVPDSLSARCTVPMVWMVHGRPLACFRPEQEGRPGSPFSTIVTVAQWPRVRAVVTMWSEFELHWRMVAGDKLRCTQDPPIDGARYSPRGGERKLERGGKYNVLIADSWRDDVDIYEVAVACWVAAGQLPGLRVHFWAVEADKQSTCWQHVWRALDERGALGEIHPRETDITDVYRAMDCLVSPHRIGVRTIGEALSCGLPVVASTGCRYTPYTADPSDPEAMAQAIVRCLEADRVSAIAQSAPRDFGLETFGRRMEEIYEEAVAPAHREEALSGTLQPV